MAQAEKTGGLKNAPWAESGYFSIRYLAGFDHFYCFE